MREIETDIQTLVSADKIHFLDHAVRQPPTSFGQVRILADANVLRPKNQLNRLPFTKSSRFFFGWQTSSADFDRSAGHDAYQKIGRSQKSGDVFTGRMIVNFVGCSHLFEMAFVEHRDVVTHLQSLFLIVRDKDGWNLDLLQKRAYLATQMHARLRIQRAERFVKEQDLRFVSQRARNRDALLLSSRELPGMFLPMFLQSHQLKQTIYGFSSFLSRAPANLQPKGNVFFHGHARKERVRLKDHAHATLAGGQIGNILAVQNHSTLVRLFQSRNDAQ